MRAKAASDANDAEGLERARRLLGNADSRVTKKCNLRKAEIVR
jgi:hypothetical protein